MLWTIRGRPKTCAVEAMSAVTGLSTNVCVEALRQITGQKTIHGTFMDDTARALRLLGYRSKLTVFVPGIKGMQPPMWRDWAYKKENSENKQLIVGIDVGGTLHDVAISGQKVADNGFLYSREPTSILDDPIAKHVTTSLGEIYPVYSILECSRLVIKTDKMDRNWAKMEPIQIVVPEGFRR